MKLAVNLISSPILTQSSSQGALFCSSTGSDHYWAVRKKCLVFFWLLCCHIITIPYPEANLNGNYFLITNISESIWDFDKWSHFRRKKNICIFHRLQLGASFFWIAPLIWLYIHSNLVKALWKDDKAKDIKAPIVLDFTHLKVEF